MNEHHAHTVLNWIMEEPAGRSINETIKWSNATHGSIATYHTCCKSGFTIQQLIAFFIEAKKVQTIGGKLVLQPENMCSH